MNNSITKFILDIGNTKIKLLAAELDDSGNSLKVLSYVDVDTQGMNRNIIENPITLSKSIEKAVKIMESETGLSIKKINIGYNGQNIFSKTTDIRIDLGFEKVVTEEDINKMFAAAREELCESDDVVLEEVIYNTKINNGGLIKSPLGLTARYLIGNIHLIYIKKNDLDELMEVLHRAGLAVESVTLNAYAAAKSTLSMESKISGVALIDIGESSTDIIIYKNDKLIFTKSLPLGGRHYVSDLGYLFDLNPQEAVSIIEKSATTRNGYYVIGDKEILIEDITNAFNARSEDFITLIMQAIEESGFKGYLEKGIEITGGVSKMREMYNWLHTNMEYPVSLVSPISILGMPNPSPQMAVCIGIVLEIMEKEYLELKRNGSFSNYEEPPLKEEINSLSINNEDDEEDKEVEIKEGFLGKFKKLLSDFI